MPERAETISPAPAPTLAVLHPLDEFYAQAGQPLPPLQQVDGGLVPEPHRTLLVHGDDMTPTLEKFHGGKLHLQVLGRRRVADVYFREVVLRLDGTEQAVEFGAIKINLALFSPAAREEILREREPLGHIMAVHQIPHVSRPSAYLRLASDRLINGVLGLSGAQMLFGRRNTLLDPQNRPLAEIVEILPPAPARGDKERS